MGRHRQEPARSGARAAGLGLLAVIVVAVVAVALTGSFGLNRVVARVAGGTTTTPPATTSPRAPSGATTGPPIAGSASAGDAAAATAALSACVRKQAAAATVVSAAATGAAHWSEHVMGQTDLAEGRRSMTEVMNDSWGPTRAAGPGDVAAFRSAKATYDAVPGCVPVTALPPSATSARLAQCVARQGRLDTYLSAATAMMADWDGHLQAMARHTAGQVSSAAAQQDWLRRWQAAPGHLDPYAAAAAALSSTPVCSA